MYSKGPLWKVTGVDCDGRRFRIVTSSAVYAMGINVWCGTVWRLDARGTWRVFRRVYN